MVRLDTSARHTFDRNSSPPWLMPQRGMPRGRSGTAGADPRAALHDGPMLPPRSAIEIRRVNRVDIPPYIPNSQPVTALRSSGRAQWPIDPQSPRASIGSPRASMHLPSPRGPASPRWEANRHAWTSPASVGRDRSPRSPFHPPREPSQLVGGMSMFPALQRLQSPLPRLQPPPGMYPMAPPRSALDLYREAMEEVKAHPPVAVGAIIAHHSAHVAPSAPAAPHPSALVPVAPLAETLALKASAAEAEDEPQASAERPRAAFYEPLVPAGAAALSGAPRCTCACTCTCTPHATAR